MVGRLEPFQVQLLHIFVILMNCDDVTLLLWVALVIHQASLQPVY